MRRLWMGSPKSARGSNRTGLVGKMLTAESSAKLYTFRHDGLGELFFWSLPLTSVSPVNHGNLFSLRDFDANATQLFKPLADSWIGVSTPRNRMNGNPWPDLGSAFRGQRLRVLAPLRPLRCLGTQPTLRRAHAYGRHRRAGSRGRALRRRGLLGAASSEPPSECPWRHLEHHPTWTAEHTELHFVPMPPESD